MYELLLIVHNLWRWVVVSAGLVAIGSAVYALRRGLPWSQSASLWGTLFGRAIDVQVLIGAGLYLIYSPLTTIVMTTVGELPAGSEVSFFGVYHGILMTLVLFDVHLSTRFIRRAHGDRGRLRRSIILYGQTLALALAAIPWWRPLLRF
jgi:hypothetical protein